MLGAQLAHDLEPVYPRQHDVENDQVYGTGRGQARISLSARFSLEKAPTFLGEEFGRVETMELSGTITVDDPEPVIAHM